MKKLFQDDKKGNCTTVCLASYFDLEIDDVPCFENIKDVWYKAMVEWAKGKGYHLVRFRSDPAKIGYNDFYIAVGRSPRGNWKHSVIYQHGKLFHDPHPSQKGLKGKPLFFWALIPFTNLPI